MLAGTTRTPRLFAAKSAKNVHVITISVFQFYEKKVPNQRLKFSPEVTGVDFTAKSGMKLQSR